MGECVRESARRLKKKSREMSVGLKTRARDASRKPRAGRSGAMEGAPAWQGRSSGSRGAWGGAPPPGGPPAPPPATRRAGARAPRPWEKLLRTERRTE
jgi:hypothetical protein